MILTSSLHMCIVNQNIENMHSRHIYVISPISKLDTFFQIFLGFLRYKNNSCISIFPTAQTSKTHQKVYLFFATFLQQDEMGDLKMFPRIPVKM